MPLLSRSHSLGCRVLQRIKYPVGSAHFDDSHEDDEEMGDGDEEIRFGVHLMLGPLSPVPLFIDPRASSVRRFVFVVGC